MIVYRVNQVSLNNRKMTDFNLPCLGHFKSMDKCEWAIAKFIDTYNNKAKEDDFVTEKDFRVDTIEVL